MSSSDYLRADNDSGEDSLRVRLLVQSRDVGSIIGKGGEVIKEIRGQSGCKVHIADGSTSERVLSIIGDTEGIYVALKKVCASLKDERDDGASNTIKMLLLISTSQCGAVIGNKGSKIKEIREASGASVRVGSDPIGYSTERLVTVTGEKENVADCLYLVCQVLKETPTRGNHVPYSPKSGDEQDYGRGGHSYGGSEMRRQSGGYHNEPAFEGGNTLAAFAAMNSSRSSHNDDPDSHITFEMSLPNEVIGAIIGKGGSKIAEIRNLSGANVFISRTEQRGSSDDEVKAPGDSRIVTIVGEPDKVALAKSLVNMTVDLFKNRSKHENGGGGSGGGGQQHHRRQFDQHRRGMIQQPPPMHSQGPMNPQLELAKLLLSKPETLSALAALQTISESGQQNFGPPPPQNHFRNQHGPRYNPY